MLLKAAINGRRLLSEHPAIPISPEQQAKQAAIAVAAGAGAIHVHPRKRMALEIHNCSRQGELIQDRAQLLQVLR